MDEIRAQLGPQKHFLSTAADIAIYGGAAFGGKTFALLMEMLRHLNNPKFSAVCFRRTSPQITVEGGLWDEAFSLYPLVGGVPREYRKEFLFPSGATIRFTHLQHDKHKLDWQGSQVPLFCFDQLEHFTRTQFEYLIFSRGRTNCGVKPYVRATCNPDPDSFIMSLISWWINEDTGYPIPERFGKIRWFVRIENNYVWDDDPKQLKERYPAIEPKSLTFIAARITDNKIGMTQCPEYLANLQALDLVSMERLLGGNWKIREMAGMFFKRSYFDIVDVAPTAVQKVRYWDRAATEPSKQNKEPDWTVGVLLSYDSLGTFYVEHVESFQSEPADVTSRILSMASQDGHNTIIGIEQDPGSAGKHETSYYVRQLIGYVVEINKVSDKKTVRARPVSSQAKARNIKLVRGNWNEAFLTELENFPQGKHDDQVDAFGGAFFTIQENQIYV